MAKAGDRKFREIFFAFNGTGPYKCFDCNEDVDFWDVLIHHENHDHSDNRLENLVPSHRSCHTVHHSTGRGVGKTPSLETRQKMTKAQRARWAQKTDEERSAIGKKAATTRAPKQAEMIQKTWETRRNQGTANILPSNETKAKMSASQQLAWIKRRGEADV